MAVTCGVVDLIPGGHSLFAHRTRVAPKCVHLGSVKGAIYPAFSSSDRRRHALRSAHKDAVATCQAANHAKEGRRRMVAYTWGFMDLAIARSGRALLREGAIVIMYK